MILKPRGTADFFDNDMREFTALKLIFRNIMSLYNYEEISTPIFESLDLFTKSVGEETDIVSKEMFIFNDKKDRQFALRPEGTAPTVRLVLEEKMYIAEKLPLKLFYLGPMFRYERPQKGRQRQFHQLGAEFYGATDIISDVEVIELANNIIKQIGIADTKCYLNYIVSGERRVKYIDALKKELSNISLCDDCQIRIEKNPLRVLDCKIDHDKFKNIIKMSSFLNDEEKHNFNIVKKLLNNLGIEVVVDELLVRGLDYYNGIVFEIKQNISQLTLVGGGRYDNLVEKSGGPSLPAIGFGLGIERILLILKEKNIKLSEDKKIDAFVISIGDKSKQASTLIGSILRNSGLSCELNHLNKNIKSGFKLAERLNSKNVIIVGEEELKNNVVKIKNQETKSEEIVSFDKIVDYFEK